MFQNFCLRKLQEFSETISLQQPLRLFICVLNVFFSIVATLGNIVVIHSLWKASSVPVHTFLRLRSMQPGRTLNNIVYTTTNEYSMYVTYRSERRKQHPGTTANCPKNVETTSSSYQFPAETRYAKTRPRVPVSRPSTP
jgi:hypothetical protein